MDGVDGYTCTCPKGLTGQSCECAYLDDRTANCSGIITPYYTDSDNDSDDNDGTPTTTEASFAEGRTVATSSTDWPDVGTSGWTDGEYAPPFKTTSEISPSPVNSLVKGPVSNMVTTNIDFTDEPEHTTDTSTHGRDATTSGTIVDYEVTYDTTTGWTRPAVSGTSEVPDYGGGDKDFGTTRESRTTVMNRGYSTPKNTVAMMNTTRRSTVAASTEKIGSAFHLTSSRPKITHPQTSTVSVSKATTMNNYQHPITTEQDIAFTTFYDEMSTDFEYNLTSFTVPVTESFLGTIDKSCANVLCLNGGTCEKSKTGHKASSQYQPVVISLLSFLFV